MSARTARAARPTGRRRLAVAGLVAVVFGLLGSLGLEAALRLRRTGGLAMPPSYWVADDELIYSGDRTWAVTNQWGGRGSETLARLLEAWPDRGVSVEVAQDA